MKEDIEKYLKFYIGQKIELDQSRFAEPEEDRVFILSGVSCGKFYIKEVECWYEMSKYHDGTPIDMLLLRPIESLTDDEKKKFTLFHLKDYPSWYSPRMIVSLCELGIDAFGLIEKGIAKDIFRTEEKIQLHKKIEDTEKLLQAMRSEYEKLK